MATYEVLADVQPELYALIGHLEEAAKHLDAAAGPISDALDLAIDLSERFRGKMFYSNLIFEVGQDAASDAALYRSSIADIKRNIQTMRNGIR